MGPMNGAHEWGMLRLSHACLREKHTAQLFARVLKKIPVECPAGGATVDALVAGVTVKGFADVAHFLASCFALLPSPPQMS